MLVKYLNNRVLLALSAAALACGIIGLVLTLTGLACEPVLVSGARNCTAGVPGVIANLFYLAYVVLAAVVSVLALVKAGVTRQYIWFAVIFLFSIFLLGPLAILPFSLLTPNDRADTVEGLREPDSSDLRDYRPPRPA
jgi:hypothetical protein